MRETATVITNRRMLGYRSWSWEEIDHFASVRQRTWLRTDNGRAWMLFGVADGRRVVWEEGETREITSLLNDRLRTMQSDAGLRWDPTA